MHAILLRIADLGDQMIEASQAHDVETLARLTAEREELVDALKTLGRPANMDPSWQPAIDAIKAQSLALTGEIDALEAHVQTELVDMNRKSQAMRTYGRPQKQAGILHDHVSG